MANSMQPYLERALPHSDLSDDQIEAMCKLVGVLQAEIGRLNVNELGDGPQALGVVWTKREVGKALDSTLRYLVFGDVDYRPGGSSP